MKLLKQHKCFDGQVQFYEHDSSETKTKMRFSTYVPNGMPHGCLIWLSGLTCNEENFITKAGAQRYLSESKLMVICPDTSPRGLNLPNEHLADDFGSGAGFYVDATTPNYRDHYRMYSYIVKELYELIQENWPTVNQKISIFGHSMGGHGALVIGLTAPEKFRSVSAFAPICNPTVVPWGKKAFMGYLGEDQENWKAYDAVELLNNGRHHPQSILVDVGTADPFLENQLQPNRLVKAAESAGQSLKLRMQQNYDHSYYFISTYIAEHIDFHAEKLSKNST